MCIKNQEENLCKYMYLEILKEKNETNIISITNLLNVIVLCLLCVAARVIRWWRCIQYFTFEEVPAYDVHFILLNPCFSSQLHQIYLGGIQQTTDVNLKDVTLHYALLVWMTGKKNPMKSPKTSPLFGDHGRHKNMTGVKSKHHRKNKNLSGGHQKPYQSSKSTPNNLPLMSIKSAKVPSSSKSSMIELTNLPKMIVPAHYIKKIISDQPLSKSIKQGSRRQRGPGSRERTGRLSTSIGSVGRRNITVNAINNHKQTTFRERLRAFPSSVRNAPTVLNTVSSPKLDRYTNDLQKTMPMRKRNHIDRYGKLRNMSASRHRTSHSLSRVKRDLVRRLQSKSSAPS